MNNNYKLIIKNKEEAEGLTLKDVLNIMRTFKEKGLGLCLFDNRNNTLKIY